MEATKKMIVENNLSKAEMIYLEGILKIRLDILDDRIEVFKNDTSKVEEINKEKEEISVIMDKLNDMLSKMYEIKLRQEKPYLYT